MNKDKGDYNMYLTELEWRGWHFSIEEDAQIFGKTKVIAERDAIEEIFM